MRLCGLVSSDANGIYTFRPDLFRSLRKLENLVDDQMTKLGAQRVLLPTLGPRHLWEKSGFAHFIVSGTPFQFVVISQITSKFRDEPHPKNGLVRGREFLMQDLYTFDTCAETAKETYSHVQAAYMKLLDNLELPYLVGEFIIYHVCCAFGEYGQILVTNVFLLVKLQKNIYLY
ncbi:unnamed protein product [Trichobilharzia regenti]|nr:unnamed protein product [Trichobilharzia regenti]